MKKTAQLFGLSTLTVLLMSSSGLAEQKSAPPAKKTIYDGIVEDYQGFPSVTYKDPFEVKFFATAEKEKKFRLNSDGGAQWIYRPLGQCAGHIRLPEIKDEASWASGAKGTFDIMCPDGFTAEGDLTALGAAKEEGILGVWSGTATQSTPPPPTVEDNAPEAEKIMKMKIPTLNFILKVKK